MFDIGTREIIIIAVVLILFFGATKIPELAKVIADTVKTIRRGFTDGVSNKKK
jgi:TatA/E family protein of Tat protein translocase